MDKQYRQFFLQIKPAAIRTATFENREHLVVPVVALVEGVLHPVNAERPELVLAEEFSHAPQSWNGRPVVGDHPIRNGQRVSANLPDVLEEESFGIIFNARVKNKQLHMDAYLDARRAEQVGKNAMEVIERVRNLETVEISVGAYVASEDTQGEYNGKPYYAIWREIASDHLAMLPKGATGACSVEMGCGAPRAASMYTLSDSGYNLVDANGCGCNKETKGMPNDKNAWQDYKDKLKDLMGRAKSFTFRLGQEEDDMSDSDVREMLNSSLQASEPGFLGVEAVFMNSSPPNVVFAADPEGPLQFFRKTFTLSGEEKQISLADEKEEVRHVVRFEPVVAQSITTNKQGEEKMDEAKKARIQALIATGKTSFVESDLEYLGTFSDERLAQLEAQAQEPEAPAADPPAETPAESQADGDAGDSGDAGGDGPLPPAKNEAELEAAYLKSAPQSIRDLVARTKSEEAQARTQLTTFLKTAQSGFSEQDMQTMTVAQLRKLAEAISSKPSAVNPSPAPPIDYSGLGAPRTASASSEEAPAPPSMVDRLKARNSA